MKARRASIKRETKETSVSATLDIDGSGRVSVHSGVAFVDHLASSFAKHAMINLELSAKSNDGIIHHLVEDMAITLGQGIDEALGTRERITRFGHASVPMDESLAEATVDLVKRPYYKLDLGLRRTKIEEVSREDLEHFIQSLLQNLNCCAHLAVRYGSNDHHKVEAAVKSLGVAFRHSAAPDKRQKGAPSTKGLM